MDFIGVTLACEGRGHPGTMDHRHQWQSEPPEGKLSWTKSWDENYGDEEDMAANAMYSSPEEIQSLRDLLRKDPGFKNSSSWPHLIEWCSTCKATRAVRLVMPEEDTVMEEEVVVEEVEVEEVVVDVKEEVFSDHKFHDACTQTPRPKKRRRGGYGSRTRRLLAFQVMLTAKRGLPISRLLSHKKTEARSAKAELLNLQEESASPRLKVKEEVVIKQEEVARLEAREDKEEVVCPREGVSSSGSSIFTLRNSQSGANPPSSQSQSFGPAIPPFSTPPPPLFTPPSIPLFQTPQYCQMPAANWGFCGGCHCWGPVLPIWVQ